VVAFDKTLSWIMQCNHCTHLIRSLHSAVLLDAAFDFQKKIPLKAYDFWTIQNISFLIEALMLRFVRGMDL
jgi:hypothetical protein